MLFTQQFLVMRRLHLCTFASLYYEAAIEVLGSQSNLADSLSFCVGTSRDAIGNSAKKKIELIQNNDIRYDHNSCSQTPVISNSKISEKEIISQAVLELSIFFVLW